jgi:hypothetical protein
MIVSCPVTASEASQAGTVGRRCALVRVAAVDDTRIDLGFAFVSRPVRRSADVSAIDPIELPSRQITQVERHLIDRRRIACIETASGTSNLAPLRTFDRASSTGRRAQAEFRRSRMMVENNSTQAGLAAQPSARQEMGWLVAVALAFLVVHIVAGTIMMRPPANNNTATGHDVVSGVYD